MNSNISVVLDPLGGDYLSALLPVLAPNARAVLYGALAGRTARLDFARLYAKGLRIIGTSGSTTPRVDKAEAIDGALQAVFNGEVVVATEIHPLQEAQTAFDRLARRSVTGKLLLQP